MRRLSLHRPSRRGVALLAVLAVITLVVILLLGFLVVMMLDRKTTGSYSQAIKVQEVGLGALEEITSDLKQEIAAGSYANGTPSGASYSTTDPVTGQPVMAYIPAANSGGVAFGAEPARIGFPAADYSTDVDYASSTTSTLLPPTLIRVSRDSSDPFYNGNIVTSSGTISASTFYPQSWAKLPPARATLTSTTVASVNGRTISVNRWNKPQIMTGFTAPPADFIANPPEWVYVGRSGSINTKTGVAFADADAASGSLYADAAGANANAILGRYAYVIYDEGALLDANVAGADATTTGTVTTSPNAPYRNKSFLSYADLTQIPGFSSSTATVTALVDWRNQGGLAAWGSYTNLAMGADTVGFLTAFGPHNTGSTSAYPTTTAATHNDNPFLSRQDLIDYANNVLGSAVATGTNSPLPYLGTFSRAVNEPSATPNSVPLYTYAQGAENSAYPNRDLANVRFASTGSTTLTVNHINDSGTSVSYTVDPGTPLLQHRFSLAKLAWLTYKGPSADLATTDPLYNAGGTDANILACFGLQWNINTWNKGTWDTNYTACPGWSYGHTSGTPASSIMTLAQVASLATPREPDFFELLKAGILNASLARDPGPVAVMATSEAGPYGQYFGWSSTSTYTVTQAYSTIPDSQIIQIGANIIDQARADNYPTAIYLAAHTIVNPWDWLYDTQFGDDDLPYLFRVGQIGFMYNGINSDGTGTGTGSSWFQPQVWNPHQQPASEPAATPTLFRISTHGAAYCNAVQSDVLAPTSTITPVTITQWGTQTWTPADYDATPALGQVFFTTNFGTNPATGTPYTSLTAFRDQPLGLVLDNPTATSTYTSPAAHAYQGMAWGMAGGPTAAANDPPTQWSSSWNAESESSASNEFVAIPAGKITVTMTLPFYTYNSGNSYTSTFDWKLQPIAKPVPAPWSVTYGPTNPPAPSSYTPALGPMTLVLEYQDANGNWEPYNLMSRLEGTAQSNSRQSAVLHGSTWPDVYYARTDPRTDRFSVSESAFANTNQNLNTQNYTMQANKGTSTTNQFFAPGSTNGQAGLAQYFTYASSAIWPLVTNVMTGKLLNYYADQDGVVRPGDQFHTPADPATSTTGDGYAQWHSSAATIYPGPYSTSGPGRPLLLHRPFRSVAELGYAFRDEPFKNLDFWSDYSGDAALLDLFTIQDEPAVVAGQVDLNNSPVTVIQSIISGGAIKEIDPTVLYSSTDLKNAAKAIALYISTNGPLKNRQDLVTAQPSYPTTTGTATTSLSNSIYVGLTTSGTKNWANKAYGEAPIRALAPVTNIRTWNLLIDVIAQSGHMEAGAKTLANFIVDGEKRYWLHIAVDRYTGQVVDEQLEPVYE